MMCSLSGMKNGAPSCQSSVFVTWDSPVPSDFITQMSILPSICRPKVTHWPSGDTETSAS